MAKAVVTFSDSAKGKGLSVQVKFDPALKDGKPITHAQRVALRFVEELGVAVCPEQFTPAVVKVLEKKFNPKRAMRQRTKTPRVS